ncbi:fluoride efflux transporter FluC [Garicola koreensis]|uniref:Fluoride-specific ion channel FluC n=1 Tax=Garicola koreensis TaxID=1262554 RepID=A0A7W5TQT0_9MICC|nr:CrcB family protein [Garicola koreensis]MBB3667435.1 CrcB protein [Garicola koreensis]
MIVELTVPVVLAAAAGGALGAAARFLLESYLRSGVLVANVLGSLLLGIMLGISAVSTSSWDAAALGFLSVGFIGALSTFATVSLHAAQLWTTRHRVKAAALWLVHTGCGLVAAGGGAWLGWTLAG